MKIMILTMMMIQKEKTLGGDDIVAVQVEMVVQEKEEVAVKVA